MNYHDSTSRGTTLLKKKSEALKRVRSFASKLNALSSVGKAEPVRIVGQLHMDNAGEFLSHLTPIFPSQQLPLKADLCTNVKMQALPSRHSEPRACPSRSPARRARHRRGRSAR